MTHKAPVLMWAKRAYHERRGLSTHKDAKSGARLAKCHKNSTRCINNDYEISSSIIHTL